MIRRYQNSVRRRTSAPLAIIAGLLALVMACAQARAERLVLQGSVAFNVELMTTYRNVIEARSGQSLTVIANKSDLGLLALFEGKASLAMISAPLPTMAERLRRADPMLPVERLQQF